MAQEKPNKLAEWLSIVREQSPTWREAVRRWAAHVMEDPSLIWQNAVVRYVTYGLAGIVLLVTVNTIMRAVSPPVPQSAKPEAVTADYHVICTAGNCGHHFVINRRFGFNGFPVTCSQCEKETGSQAIKCPQMTCQRWVVPIETETGRYCPECDYGFPVKP